MAFANVSDIVATTIQSRSRQIADNVTKNNALLSRLNQRGNIKTISGGNVILEELSFAENGNAGFYSGYDLLPVAAQDVISAAEFSIKQFAVPVVMSGLEMLQNSGKEAFIDLLEARLNVAEATMMNKLAQSVYSDGTGSGGKEITGLNAAVASTNTSGTYGGIDRATWTFWQNKKYDFSDNTVTPGPTTIQNAMNTLWASCTRGNDRPDLIVVDTVYWGFYMSSLQALQRFSSPETGNLGFPSLKFMDADVVLDGGIGGFCPASTGFFLNTKYLKWRPHKDRNMVPLSPNRRYAINQDAEVQILGWAGNLTCSGAQFQGRLQN
ncbi:MAG: phage major capsid protein [Alphaproteobacteria bacterium]